MPDFEYLKYIRVYGLEEDTEEIFQGLGGAAAYGNQPPAAATPIPGTNPETEQDTVAIQAAWDIQTEMLDLEIARFNMLLNSLNAAESIEMPTFEDDGTPRSPRAIPLLPILLFLKGAWTVYTTLKDVYELGQMAYEVYKRFWHDGEELKNLPGAIIDLLEKTIAILEKLKGLDASRENFSLRQEMVDTLSQRLDGQMELYRAGKSAAAETVPDLTDLTQSLMDLQYNDESIELPSGLKLSKSGRLIQGGY